MHKELLKAGEAMLVTPSKTDLFVPVNDEYRPFPGHQGRTFRQAHLEIPIMVRALKLPARGRILEIGCGQGVALAKLAELCQPARLVGVDIDPELLQKAKKRLREAGVQAELYQQDVRHLQFADAAFDMVIDFGTLYHINRRVRALREIRRVLCPRGLIVYETRLNQFLSHPLRSFGKRLPWKMAPELKRSRSALLWASRVRV